MTEPYCEYGNNGKYPTGNYGYNEEMCYACWEADEVYEANKNEHRN